MVCFNRGRKGKKGQQRKKDSPTESPTSPQKDGFKFDGNTKANILHTLHCKIMVVFQESNCKSGSDDADDNDEEWSVDTSEDAVKARMEKMTNGVATLTMHSDLEKTSSERVDLFYKFTKVCSMCACVHVYCLV